MPANAGEVRNAGLILGLGRSPEEKMATHSSILTRRTHGQRRLEGFGPQGRRVGYDWNDLACMHTGRRSAPRYPHPDPQNLRIHHLPWQTGRSVSDRVEVANHLTLRWSSYPGWARWAQYNHRNPSTWRGKKWVKERDMATEAGQKDAVTDSENEGATSPGMQVALRSRKSQGNGFSPRTYRKECGPAKPWISAQWDRCQISNLRKCKIFNLYCFKPLSF